VYVPAIWTHVVASVVTGLFTCVNVSSPPAVGVACTVNLIPVETAVPAGSFTQALME
jgi:hypothetical protein